MSQIEKVVVSAQQNIQPKHSNNISPSLSMPIDNCHPRQHKHHDEEAHTPVPPGVTHIKRIGTMY